MQQFFEYVPVLGFLAAYLLLKDIFLATAILLGFYVAVFAALKITNKEITKKLDQVIKSTLKIAEKNIETIMPGFTHLKNAQAVSFAHYLMAYVEMFNRDKKRFINNLDNLNENPLGVVALRNFF